MEKINTENAHSGSPAPEKVMKKNSNNGEYDAAELANLLKLCKGNRSTTDFSKETGVSITYLTKLMNGNSPSRPSKKYLKRIAYPESGNCSSEVSYEQLLKAAGYSEFEISQAALKEEPEMNLPAEAKRKSFPISFMIDNLNSIGESDIGFDIHNADNNGWFVISTDKSSILCVPAIYDDTEIKEKELQIAHDFMVATLTQQDLDSYYILTNQKNLVDDIKKVLPKLPGIDLYILLTNDYHTISDRKLVCY